MKNKCEFCEEYEILKSESDKECAEDSEFHIEYRVSIREDCYFKGELTSSCSTKGHKINFCPVCGKEIKEGENNA